MKTEPLPEAVKPAPAPTGAPVTKATPAKKPTAKAAKKKPTLAKRKSSSVAKGGGAAGKCKALTVGYPACKCGGPLCGSNITS